MFTIFNGTPENVWVIIKLMKNTDVVGRAADTNSKMAVGLLMTSEIEVMVEPAINSKYTFAI